MVQAVVNAAMISMGRSPQRATERPPDVSFGRCRMRSTRRCKRRSEVVLNPQHFPSVLRHTPPVPTIGSPGPSAVQAIALGSVGH